MAQINQRALCLSISALALYLPANLYPFMIMNYSGNYRETTIWDGIRSLFESNMWLTATVVLAASIIIPVLKLLCLLFLSILGTTWPNRQLVISLRAFLEAIGRWSMLDVFLLAIMVALVKFGSFATVSAGVGSYLLALVVILSMFASTALHKDDYAKNY